jgi:hypothetical protein
VRALRNLQQRPTVDGGHFNLGAEPGFLGRLATPV